MDRKRKLIIFRNYFNEFFDSQPERVKDKIDYVLFLIATSERIPRKFFQYMNDLKTTEESVPFSIAIPNCNL